MQLVTWQERGQLAAMTVAAVLLGAKFVVHRASALGVGGPLRVALLVAAVAFTGYGLYAVIHGLRTAHRRENVEVARLYRALTEDQQQAVRAAVERGAELDPYLLPLAARFAAARTRAIPTGWLFAGGAAAMADNSSIPIVAGVVGGCCVVIGTITVLAYARVRRRSEEFLARRADRPSMSEQ